LQNPGSEKMEQTLENIISEEEEPGFGVTGVE
jgi:hypothetical protein